MKKTFAAILVLLFGIALAVVLGEIFIRILVAPSAEQKNTFLQELPSKVHPQFASLKGPLMAGYIAHPFWGFQANPDLSGVNNFGFKEEESLPYSPKKNEFVIGLFGGSVALINYQNLKTILEGASKKLRCERQLKLINFALEGFRQPSQLNISSYFLDSLDATVNLDGNNEVTATRSAGLPADYPEFYHDLYAVSPEKLEALNAAYAWEKRKAQWAFFTLRYPVLLKSDLLFFLSLRALAFFEKQKWTNMVMAEKASPDFGHNQKEWEKMQDGLQSWERFTRRQHQMAQVSKVTSFFFIQPSQYSPDGKKFTAQEKAAALYPDASRVEMHRKIFEALRFSGLRLQEEGLKVFDLMSLFANKSETVYVDTCCHLNEFGNQILAQEISRILIAEINRLPCPR